jgi:signal peptidase I
MNAPHNPPLATISFRLLHLTIGTAIFALLLRTWVVMGLVEPVTVSGSSMAPTLVGPHVEAACDRCLQRVRIGADQVPNKDYLPCPNCDGGRVVLAAAAWRRGTPMWIDRVTYQWRNPRRWEMIVFRSPAEDGQLCVKRVVGLPGERVHLAGGDVWIDGQRQRKTLPAQRSVRQLVRKGADYIGAAGEIKAPASCFSGKFPVDDGMIYNARLSRRLNVLPDIFLSARLTCRGAGRLLLQVEDGPILYQLELVPKTNAIRLSRQGQMILERRLRVDLPRRLAAGEVLMEVSTFDRQLLVALDGEVWLRYPLDDLPRPEDSTRARSISQNTNRPSAAPFAIGSERLQVRLTKVTLWRDIYYQLLPARALPAASGGGGGLAAQGGGHGEWQLGNWQLAPDELFLLGDNAPVSADSRIWANAGIPLKFLVGRPLTLR